jgi:Flp pilus assembly protein TadD
MTMRPWLLMLAFSLSSAARVFSQAPCKPPESMKSQLQGKPTTDTLNELGGWFGEHKQFDCAANVFAASLQAEPDQKNAPHVAFMFAVSLDLAGDLKEAIPALQAAEQLGYRDIKLHVILAEALDATHATKDAEEEWRQALEFDPELSSALDALSDDLLLDNDYAGAIAALEVPRLVGQRTPQQSLNLATAYVATGRLDEAARVLRDGLNTSPDSLDMAKRLSSVLIQLHRADQAVALLELTVAKHPEDPEAKADLAKAQAMVGGVK